MLTDDDTGWADCEGIVECSVTIAQMPFEYASDNLGQILGTAEVVADTAGETARATVPSVATAAAAAAADASDAAFNMLLTTLVVTGVVGVIAWNFAPKLFK